MSDTKPQSAIAIPVAEAEATPAPTTLVRVCVDYANIARFLQHGSGATTAVGLPADATLVTVYDDPHNPRIWFVYSHPSFAPVAEGETLPELRVTFTGKPVE